MPLPLDEEIPLILERDVTAPEGTNGQLVGFGNQVVSDAHQSRKKGYPVHKEVPFFKCITPGDSKTVYCQPAQDSHKERFPRAWAAFQNRTTNPIQGMPIEQWPQLTRALAWTFRSMGIHTVEALAEIHDGNIGTLGQQGREWRAKAKAFLQIANDTAASQQLAAREEVLRRELDEKQKMIVDLASRIESLEKKRGPGRPRKQEVMTA